MKSFEFDTLVAGNGLLTLPKEKLSELKEGEKIHVVVYAAADVATNIENEQWQRLGMESFFAGYEDTDDFYEKKYGDKATAGQ